MDWITFIKWNGITYASYYGVNLLVDFMHIKRQATPKEAFVKYQLKDLGIEEPRTIRSSDFLFVDKEKEVSEEQANSTKTEKEQLENAIAFSAPIESQGIPINEFLKTAHQFSNKIYNPNI